MNKTVNKDPDPDFKTLYPSSNFSLKPTVCTAVGYFIAVESLSCVQLCVTPWTASRQAPPSMGFSRQEYWSGLPHPSPGDLPDAGTEPTSPALAGGFFYH